MSCYLISSFDTKKISDEIINFWTQKNYYLAYIDFNCKIVARLFTRDMCNAKRKRILSRWMYAINRDSVCCRYSHKKETLNPSYEQCFVEMNDTKSLKDAFSFMKASDSWLYQSCESKNNKLNEMYASLKSLIKMIAMSKMRDTEAYNNAEWF